MKVDIKGLVERAKKSEPDRGQISLYADKALFKDFQTACDAQDIKASRVLEQFMREFVEAAEKPKK